MLQLHFLSKTKKKKGHVLNCKAKQQIKVCFRLGAAHLTVPGVVTSTDNTPWADREEPMCCMSAPCGSLEGMTKSAERHMLYFSSSA